MNKGNARRNDGEPIDRSRRASNKQKKPRQDQEKQVLRRQVMLQGRMRKKMRKRVESRLSFVIQGVPQGQSTLSIVVPTGRSGHGVDIASEGELLRARIGDRVTRRKSFSVRVACRRSR